MVHAAPLSVVRQWGVIPTAAEVLVRGAGGAQVPHHGRVIVRMRAEGGSEFEVLMEVLEIH